MLAVDAALQFTLCMGHTSLHMGEQVDERKKPLTQLTCFPLQSNAGGLSGHLHPFWCLALPPTGSDISITRT